MCIYCQSKIILLKRNFFEVVNERPGWPRIQIQVTLGEELHSGRRHINLYSHTTKESREPVCVLCALVEPLARADHQSEEGIFPETHMLFCS